MAYQEHCGLLQRESQQPIAMQVQLCAWPVTCVWPPQHSGVNSSDTQVLTLYNVTEEESGEYICKASNYIGQANQSAWLTVTQPSKGNARPRLQRCQGRKYTARQGYRQSRWPLTHLPSLSSLFSGALCCKWCHGKSQQSNWKYFGFCLYWKFPSFHACATLCPPNKGAFCALWRITYTLLPFKGFSAAP